MLVGLLLLFVGRGVSFVVVFVGSYLLVVVCWFLVRWWFCSSMFVVRVRSRVVCLSLCLARCVLFLVVRGYPLLFIG